jgi:hypothetical protein
MNRYLSTREGQHLPAAETTVRYHTVEFDGIKILYREAGPQDAPALLLLHGFPSASHMFTDLIPRLAEHVLTLE